MMRFQHEDGKKTRNGRKGRERRKRKEERNRNEERQRKKREAECGGFFPGTDQECHHHLLLQVT